MDATTTTTKEGTATKKDTKYVKSLPSDGTLCLIIALFR